MSDKYQQVQGPLISQISAPRILDLGNQWSLQLLVFVWHIYNFLHVCVNFSPNVERPLLDISVAIGILIYIVTQWGWVKTTASGLLWAAFHCPRPSWSRSVCLRLATYITIVTSCESYFHSWGTSQYFEISLATSIIATNCLHSGTCWSETQRSQGQHRV